MRMDGRPTISVVVASCGDGSRVAGHIASLLPECERLGAELVVVHANHDAAFAETADRFPTVRWVRCDRESTRFEIRSRGMAEAEGDIVTIVDDSEPVAPDRLGHLRPLREPTGEHPGNETPAETAAQAAWQDEWSAVYDERRHRAEPWIAFSRVTTWWSSAAARAGSRLRTCWRNAAYA
jgi:hypothetical protein